MNAGIIIGLSFFIYLCSGLLDAVAFRGHDFPIWRRTYWLSSRVESLAIGCAFIAMLATMTPNQDDPAALAGLHIILFLVCATVYIIFTSIIEGSND